MKHYLIVALPILVGLFYLASFATSEPTRWQDLAIGLLWMAFAIFLYRKRAKTSEIERENAQD